MGHTLFLGEINLNPRPVTPTRNALQWELLAFHSCSFSKGQMDYQFHSLAKTSNDV